MPAPPGLAQDGAPADLPEVEQREFTLGAAEHGQRLDKVLAALVPEFSRSYLQQLLQQGAVQLNGRAGLKPAHKVGVGDALQVQMRPTEQSQAFRPEAMALQVVHEDPHLLVIDKPAGLVVHPAAGHWSGTLLNGLLARDAAAAALPRAGIVHRLDKDTSGLMVVARSRVAMEGLTRAIAAREVQRRYLAICWGRWSPGVQRCIDAPIGRDPRNRLRMAVVDLALHPGKTARTEVEGLASDGGLSLLRCRLHTGRTHQIRVHLASLGHPLVADALYGGAPAGALQRQALHAFSLALAHPVTGEALHWRAPLPADLQAALQALGLHYNDF
ncbi:RluA family pseudouridine synthase [Comamonas sp. NLF-1-9]|uniref:RluA family pseudouridine synthase n=1 Tax=Comamonas sp. NLF-1-9 TaxID=2853163 RepID=UPI001C46D2A0|nr:RluA family pseudouridine synthase [Comamonas sp. NLF-1-9]QXL85541.1 RluA family pseudouridine synthase [Comamonas sp. NLF-1-9]